MLGKTVMEGLGAVKPSSDQQGITTIAKKDQMRQESRIDKGL